MKLRFCSGALSCAALILSSSEMLTSRKGLAQVVSDNSTGTTVIQTNNIYEIVGGTTVGGRNLFHSFDRFNVPNQGAVNFLNDPSVVNIFSRVTGGKVSQIDGILRSRGAANFFLINPSGIVFGRQAELDVGGSFIATTFESLLWDNGFQFNSTQNDRPDKLLTLVGDPSGFLSSLKSPASIQVKESNLIVPEGKSLVLAGGKLVLDGSVTGAPSGRIELVSAARNGELKLSKNFSLSVPDELPRDDILIDNQALVSTLGSVSGDVRIQGRKILVTNGAQVASISQERGVGGGLTINASELVEVGNPSSDGQDLSSLFVASKGSGTVGTLTISTPKLILRDGGTVGSEASSSGIAGDVSVTAPDSIEISGAGIRQGQSFVSSLYGSAIEDGQVGSLSVLTKDLRLQDGGVIFNRVGGRGQVGDLIIQATNSVNVVGALPFPSNSLITIQLLPESQGKAGDFKIQTPQLLLSGGGQVSISQQGNSLVGGLFVRASEVEVTGIVPNTRTPSSIGSQVFFGAQGRGSDLLLEANQLNVRAGGLVATSTFGAGDAGNTIIRVPNITLIGTAAASIVSAISTQVQPRATGNGGNLVIETGRLIVQSGAQINASTFGSGNAGNIQVRALLDAQAPDVTLAGRGDARFPSVFGAQVAPRARGRGGNITIEAKKLEIVNGAAINVSAFGIGDAGQLDIQASDLELSSEFEIPAGIPAFGSSQIGASVEIGGQGKGGSIRINTQRLGIRDGGQISVSTFGQGAAGTLSIVASDINIQGTNKSGQAVSGLAAQVASGATGTGGNIVIETSNLALRDRGLISVATFGVGKSGSITISSDQLLLIGGTSTAPTAIQATVGQTAQGDSGNITVNSREIVLQDSSNIGAFSDSAGRGGDLQISANKISFDNASSLSANTQFGEGGNIQVNAQDLLLLRQASNITTSVFGSTATGDGGNININSKFIVAIPKEDSDITADAVAGNGGRVQINAKAIFGIEPSSRQTPRSDITASSDLGISGTITINSPNTELIQNSLTQLSQSVIDTNTLLINSCIARSRENGSFYITGTGGLPTNPGDVSTYSTGIVQPIAPSWKRGNVIVEPQGVYQLPDGALILSRECS